MTSLHGRMKLKIIIQDARCVTVLLIAALLASLFFIPALSHSASSMSFEAKKKEFINRIPEIVEKYIGIPYEYGGDFKNSEVIDNSHLFYLIYDEAARHAGLRWEGYRQMKELLEQSVEISREDLRNGDLVFLDSGHAAMIYKFKDPDHFNLIYASLKREEVISFHCRNIGFKVYWLKNLKGYYRPTDVLLEQDHE